MAVSNLSVTDTYDALLSTTLRNYRKKMVDNIFGSLPLLYWLNQKGRKRVLDGGEKIVIPLLYGENTTVQRYSGYDIVDVTPQEGITSSIWNWGNVSVSITIDRESERKNSGQHRLVNLFETKVMQAEKSIKWYLNDLLHGRHGGLHATFTGGDAASTVDSTGGTVYGAASSIDTTTGICSLDHIVRMGHGLFGIAASGAANGASSHTVGGILCSTTTSGGTYTEWDDFTTSANTNSWWLNYSNPGVSRLSRGAVGGQIGTFLPSDELIWAGYYNGAAAPSSPSHNLVYAMGAMYYRLSTEGDKPDLMLAGQDVFQAYENAQIPQERYMDRKVADAGFDNLKFHGATFIYDHGILTGIPATPAQNTAPPAPLYMLNSDYLEWTVDKESDFSTTPFVKPSNQLARTAQIVLMGQLVCSNRSKQGVIGVAGRSGGWTT